MFILFSIEVTSCVSKQLQNIIHTLEKFIIMYRTLVKVQGNEFSLVPGVENKLKTPNECVKTDQLKGIIVWSTGGHHN